MYQYFDRSSNKCVDRLILKKMQNVAFKVLDVKTIHFGFEIKAWKNVLRRIV